MAKITPGDLEVFFDRYKPHNFAQGETILRAGDTPAGVYFLKKGFVRVYSISKSGEELTLVIFRPGDIFPLTWVINNIPNDYFAEAMTACELRRAPREDFFIFIKAYPAATFELLEKTLVRLSGLLRRMEYMVFGNAYAKIASILLICAQRFGIKRREGIIIQVPLTHGDIASLVGVSRETASIEVKKLEKKRFIGHKGRLILVRNPRGLRHESLLGS